METGGEETERQVTVNNEPGGKETERDKRNRKQGARRHREQ
jgi:hypothetical protein